MPSPEPQIAELLDYIIRHMVDEPDEVEIEEEPGRRVTIYKVLVAEADRGKVIGKEGRIANALRTIAKAAASSDRQAVAVEIVT